MSPAALDEVVHEIILMERRARDAATGLLYHGWDESRQQRWANIETGLSPHFGRVRWAGTRWRWWMCSISCPPTHPERRAVSPILDRLAEAVGARPGP